MLQVVSVRVFREFFSNRGHSEIDIYSQAGNGVGPGARRFTVCTQST